MGTNTYSTLKRAVSYRNAIDASANQPYQPDNQPAKRTHETMTDNGMYFEVAYTDTFGGEPNYSWIRRATVWMPEMTHYGYDGGTNYGKVAKVFNRELMKRAKREMGLTGVRGRTYEYGGGLEFRPYGSNTVLLVIYKEHAADDKGAA